MIIGTLILHYLKSFQNKNKQNYIFKKAITLIKELQLFQ
jgi:hypothetical protein